MLPFDTFNVSFGGGLETKTDPKKLQPGKLLRCENVEFTKLNTVRTRWGSTSPEYVPLTGPSASTDPLVKGGSAVEDWSNPTAPTGNPRGLAATGDTLALLTDQALYSYSQTNNAWLYQNYYNPITHEVTPLVSSNEQDYEAECATAGGVVVHCTRKGTGAGNAIVVTLYDEATGAFLGGLSAVGISPRAVAIGDFVVVVFRDDVNNALRAWRIIPSDIPGTLAAPDYELIPDLEAAQGRYAITEATADYAVIVWDSDDSVVAGMRVGQLEDIGTIGITSTFTGSTQTPASNLDISYDSATGDAIIGFSTTAPDSQYVIITASTLASTSNATAAESDDVVFIAVGFYRQYVAGTLGRKILMVSTLDGASGGLENHITRFRRGTDVITTVRHSNVLSNVYSNGTQAYVLLFHQSLTGLQDSFYLADAVGRIIGHVLPRTADFLYASAYLPGMRSHTGNTFQCSLLYRRRIDAQTDDISVFEHTGAKRLVFNLDAKPVSDRFSNTAYLSGSFLWCHDGRAAQEAGLLMFPDMLDTAISEVVGGFTVGGEVYTYRVYYCKRLGSGEVCRSKAVQIVTPAVTANRTLRLTIPTLAFARFGDEVWVEVYRSLADAAAPALHYRVSSPDATSMSGANRWVQNDITADTLTFDDNMSDDDVSVQAVDYLSFGEAPHDAPPGPAFVKTVGSHLYCFGGGIEKNEIWSTKPYRPNHPAEFSESLVTDDVPDSGGKLVAMAALGEIPVGFKERSVFALAGAAPDQFAQGEHVQLGVLSDLGCSAPGTVVNSTLGVIFKSHKGFYFMKPDRTLAYVGADIESLNGRNFISGAQIPDTNSFIFVADDGNAVVYDYLSGQWGEWTNHQGLGVASWGDSQMATLKTDGTVLLRTPDSYQDSGFDYGTVVRTAPIRPFEPPTKWWHLSKFQLLGAYLSGHTLRCKLYYNREPAPFQTFTFTPSTVINLEGWGTGTWGTGTWGGTPNPENPVDYHFEKRPRRPRVQTISFEFEVLPGVVDPGGAAEFSELLLEAAPIPGMSRLSAARKL